MKYRVTFTLTNPARTVVESIKGYFNIKPSQCFEYGNQKCMIVQYDQASGMNDGMYDIRYDRRYRSDDEPGYIKRFIRETYDGKMGSWKAAYIRVRECK